MKTDNEKASEMAEAFKPLAEMGKPRLGQHRFGKWTIHFDPPPIPDRNHDWHYVHADYDGAPDGLDRHDGRCGACASIEDCFREIIEFKDAEYDKCATDHDILVERSFSAMTIADGDEGHERIPRDCPMLASVSELRKNYDACREAVGKLKLEALAPNGDVSVCHTCDGTGFVPS